MSEQEQLDVLAVFSHPDDAELTMAGTLIKLKALGYQKSPEVGTSLPAEHREALTETSGHFIPAGSTTERD